MQRKLPGIDIPAATEAKILHAAAFLEFKQHVERLAREGSDLAAYTCWMHGVEVCHSPYVMATGTDSDLFPPLPKMPCCVENCERCAAHFRGSSSPGSGFATAEASCCRQMWLPTKLRTILQASGEDGPAVVGGGLHQLYDRQPTWCHRSSMPCSSGAHRVTLGSCA